MTARKAFPRLRSPGEGCDAQRPRDCDPQPIRGVLPMRSSDGPANLMLFSLCFSRFGGLRG